MKKFNIFLLVLILIVFVAAIFLYKDKNDNKIIEEDKRIEEYLEENVAWTNYEEGKAFCSYVLLNDDSTDRKLYLNVLCQEFRPVNGKLECNNWEQEQECLKNGTDLEKCDASCNFVYFDPILKEESGTSGPVELIQNEQGEIIGHWRPRDGSLFGEDLSQEFGAYYLNLYQESTRINTTETLEKMNQNKAKDYFDLDFEYEVGEVLDQSCNSDFECETPEDYLLRSNCRYQSWCIDNKCTVVCPNLH